jgi:hypothetical protein
LGVLSEVIFNPERKGVLGIVVLAPGQMTPTFLAQYEQLATTYVCRPLQLPVILTEFFPLPRQNLSWIISTSHSGFNPGSIVDLLPDFFFQLMSRGEGTIIGDLVNRVFNRPWVLSNTDVVFVEYGLNKPKYLLLRLGESGLQDYNL